MANDGASKCTAGSGRGCGTDTAAAKERNWDEFVDRQELPMSRKDRGRNQSFPENKPQNFTPWNREGAAQTGQTAAVSTNKTKAPQAPGGVHVTGTEQDKAQFCAQIKQTTGLDVKIDGAGKLTITGEDPAKGNKIAAKAVRDAVESGLPLEAKLVKDTKVFVDTFKTKEIDIGDIQKAIDKEPNLGGSLLTHIFVERKVAAEYIGNAVKNGAQISDTLSDEAYKAGHRAAQQAEAKVVCGPEGCLDNNGADFPSPDNANPLTGTSLDMTYTDKDNKTLKRVRYTQYQSGTDTRGEPVWAFRVSFPRS